MKQGKAKNARFRDLGKNIYEWSQEGKMRVNPGAKSKDFRAEFERVSTLIRYVKSKQTDLGVHGPSSAGR